MITRLNQNAQFSLKIHQRMIAREQELAQLIKTEKTRREEYERQLQGYELERVQLITELNALFKAPAAKIVRHAHKSRSRWTPEQLEQLAQRIEARLVESAGLTRSALARHCVTHPEVCQPLLRNLVKAGRLRRVKVDVILGRGGVRKFSGYALPLKAVAATACAA